MRCTHCSKEISEDSTFCEFCGKKVIKLNKLDKNSENEIYSDVINHLEFLGYEVETNEIEDDWYSFLARHSARSNLLVRFHPNIGFSFSAIYTLEINKVVKRKSEFLELLNDLNNHTILTCFGLTNDNSTLSCYAWYPPEYSKKLFGAFTDFFDADIKKGLDQLRSSNFS